MKTNTDSITIGRDPVLTFSVLKMIQERRQREARRAAFWNGLKAKFNWRRKS